MSDVLDGAVRVLVLDRDDYQCQVCGRRGEDAMRIHHVRFRSQQGTNDLSNLVTLCFRCHAAVHEGTLRVAYREWQTGHWACFWERE